MRPLKRTAKGFGYIMVVCDHYTKWVEAYALRNLTANEAAQRLAQFIFRYGIPETILSDQGTNFQSQILGELWDLLDVRRARTSPMHPQTDGLSERFNQTLRKMLSAFVSVKQNDWDQYLSPLCFAYKTAVHSTTRCTPFELMFGRKPKVPLDLALPSIDVDLCLDPEEYAAKCHFDKPM